MCAARERIVVKGQVVGLTVALGVAVASSWAATIQPTASITAKQAKLQGVAMRSATRAEPAITRLIVKLRNASASEMAQPMSASRMQALTATAGVSMKSMRAMSGGASLLALDAAVPLSEAKNIAERLALNPAVEYAEPDILMKKLATPNETRFMEWQWNLFAPTATYAGVAPGTVLNAPTTTTGGANLPLAWDLTTGASNAVVAIIDTGITNHTDLNGQPPGNTYIPAGRFLAGYDFISSNVGAGELPANFAANDGDGRDADPSDPGDWVTAAEEALYPTTCNDSEGRTAAGTERMSLEWSLRQQTT